MPGGQAQGGQGQSPWQGSNGLQQMMGHLPQRADGRVPAMPQMSGPPQGWSPAAPGSMAGMPDLSGAPGPAWRPGDAAPQGGPDMSAMMQQLRGGMGQGAGQRQVPQFQMSGPPQGWSPQAPQGGMPGMPSLANAPGPAWKPGDATPQGGPDINALVQQYLASRGGR